MEVPAEVQRLVGPPETWRPQAPDLTWTTDDLQIEFRPSATASVPPPGSLGREASLLEWAAERFPCPRVVGFSNQPEGSWLVTTIVAGTRGDNVEELLDVASAAFVIGGALGALHRLDPAGLGNQTPFLERIEANLSALDPEGLPDPYCRYSPEELFRFWSDGVRDTDDADLVVCHGNPTVVNFVLARQEAPGSQPDGSTEPDFGVSGLVGLSGLGVGDRHLDLAIAQLSILTSYGPDAIFAFYEGYGEEPNLLRLDNAVLGLHLL